MDHRLNYKEAMVIFDAIVLEGTLNGSARRLLDHMMELAAAAIHHLECVDELKVWYLLSYKVVTTEFFGFESDRKNIFNNLARVYKQERLPHYYDGAVAFCKQMLRAEVSVEDFLLEQPCPNFEAGVTCDCNHCTERRK